MTRTTRPESSTDPWLIVTAVLAVVLLFLVGVAALWLLGSGGDGTAASPSASASASAPAISPSASAAPSASPSAEPSGGALSPSPPASPEPSAAPSASPEPSASAGASPSPDATGCSGSAENREFYAKAADTLPFDVYCADLPSGWSLVTASYRSAGGGKLEISYKGPGGATFVLRQGPDACTGVDGCPPSGSTLGEASFGDRAGTLLDTDAGFAVDASEGATFYIAETTVVGRETTTALTSALVKITEDATAAIVPVPVQSL